MIIILFIGMIDLAILFIHSFVYIIFSLIATQESKVLQYSELLQDTAETEMLLKRHGYETSREKEGESDSRVSNSTNDFNNTAVTFRKYFLVWGARVNDFEINPDRWGKW